MLVAAALVPDTALLVPGAGGDADPGAALWRAAEAAVGDAVNGVDRVVVVARGQRDRLLAPPLRGSLAAAGVPDELLRWRSPGPAEAPVPAVPASVALFLLARQHHANRAASVLEVAATSDEPAGRAAALRARGSQLVDDGRTALVVVGSPSGRHGPDGPLADDPRAPAYDDALVADLADAGIEARARLAALDRGLAAELAVTGWGPWQVLLGAVGDGAVVGKLLVRHALAGATHAVLTWRALP